MKKFSNYPANYDEPQSFSQRVVFTGQPQARIGSGAESPGVPNFPII